MAKNENCRHTHGYSENCNECSGGNKLFFYIEATVNKAYETMGKKGINVYCDIVNVEEQKRRLFKKMRYFFGMKVV